jgi:hypothetical protein
MLVTSSDLKNGRIVSWASRADANNTLYFAVRDPTSSDGLAVLSSVTKNGSVVNFVWSIMKITVDNVLTTANPRAEYDSPSYYFIQFCMCLFVKFRFSSMVLSSWDALYVLGTPGNASTYGLYEVQNSNLSKLGTLEYPPLDPTIMRNPFFVQYGPSQIAFRLAGPVNDTVWISDRLGRLSPVIAIDSTPFSNAIIFGPVRYAAGTFAVVVAGSISDTQTQYDRQLFGATISARLTVSIPIPNVVDRFRGIFVAENTTFLYFDTNFARINETTDGFFPTLGQVSNIYVGTFDLAVLAMAIADHSFTIRQRACFRCVCYYRR